VISNVKSLTEETGIYVSALPELSIAQDFMAVLSGVGIPEHTVSIDEADEHVLRIDIEAAWKELDLRPGWGNEVDLKVYFTIGQ
jgi:hypothetical protein